MSGSQALLVVAHPCDDSYCRALADAAERGLVAGGHTVDRIDLYEVGFRTAMSRAERLAYETDDPISDPQVADHAQRLLAAETLVFVYPTWWAGLPAIVKGWLERVLVPGVGFRFDERTGKVRPGLSQLRRIVGVSTYGSPRWYVRLVNDAGRRILRRSLRMASGPRARTSWLALYALDTTTDDQRRDFLARVETRMAEF
jgi:putative NADPH-quinone reductase